MKYGTTPVQLADGRYFVKVSSGEDGKRVFIQLNNTKLMSDMSDDEVTLQIDEKYHEQITDLDASTVEAAKLNSAAWFGKELSAKTLDAAASKSLVDSSMDVGKLMNKDQTVLVKVYDHTKTETSDPVLSGTVCDILLECTGVWFLKKTYGLVWRIIQVRLKSPPKKSKVSQYMFQDDADEEEDEEEEEYF
jgi:hypothetical protein